MKLRHRVREAGDVQRRRRHILRAVHCLTTSHGPTLTSTIPAIAPSHVPTIASISTSTISSTSASAAASPAAPSVTSCVTGACD